LLNSKLKDLKLGNAWSANTINAVIFRHHAILTVGHLQFLAFYRNLHKIRVFQRDLNTEQIVVCDIEGAYNLQDAHNCISLGVDRQGFLHISYDHHGSKLRYRRSKHPLDIHEWSDELPMSGKYEDKVTYPAFLIQPNGKPMLLLYRDGIWNRGTARLKEYSEETCTWTDRAVAILSGADHWPWTSNAYWNHPTISSDGTIHLSFVWRTDFVDQEKRINNSNIDYAQSVDSGMTWVSSRQQKLLLPITQVNSETLFAVAPGSNLINQTSMALDSKELPHIVFYSDDPDNIPQYQHLWFDGRQWQHRYITKRTIPFVLRGGGTLRLPISRPEVVIDDDDRVFVIYRGDLTDNKIVAQRLLPPLYEPDFQDTVLLWDKPVGQYEPIIDRLRWQRDKILTMYVQYCEQPDREGSAASNTSSAYLIDRDVS
jgi:BNR repeat-containing family member